MPRALLDFLGYKFFFWSNEKGEPVHIHVCKGDPHANATKFWITRDGIELAKNNSHIPTNDLKKIQRYIYTNRETIIATWYSYFGFENS